MKQISIFSALIVLLATHSSIAAINIKPGLWEVKSTVTSEGKQVDTHAKVKEALEKLPLEQRAEVENRFASKAQLAPGSAYQVCFTKDLLEHDDAFGREKETGRCSRTVRSQTGTKTILDFKCRDGSTGTSEWNVVDNEHYNGKVVLASSKRPTTQIDHTGTFISADCGSVKPLMQPPRKSPNWKGKGG